MYLERRKFKTNNADYNFLTKIHIKRKTEDDINSGYHCI